MGFFDKIKKIGIFNGFSQLTDDFYDELEESLVMADLGAETTLEAVEELKSRCKAEKIKDIEGARQCMRDILAEYLTTGDLSVDMVNTPAVVLFIGVNGVGKTTTIGKLAWQYKQAGNKVVLGAADTFRAAAIEQLDIWGQRVGVPVIKQKMGSDPAAVAFDTLQSAKAQGADVVIIDTAGRLHNKINLMNELTKVKSVMKRVVPDAPQEILLVLDGSTGQNAFEQARQFMAATEINNLAVTKLDGTSRGGVVIGISDQFKIPVKYIGLGEGMEDLQIFHPTEFVRSLFGDAI